MFFALARFLNRFVAKIADKGKAHIGNGGGAVKPALLLHLQNDVFDHFELVLRKVQSRLDPLVALGELACGKAERNARFFRVVFDQVHDAVQTAVYRASALIFGTKVDAPGSFLVVCHMKSVVNEFPNAFVFGGRNRDDRDPEKRLHAVDVNLTAVAPHLVHHIEREYHRNVEFHELHGQIKVALDIGRVHDIDNALRLFIEDKGTRNDLLLTIRRERIDTRQVGHERFGVILDRAALAVNRHARKIADVLVGTCQLVKERGLAAVLVAGKCKGQDLVIGQRVFLGFDVIFAAFAITGVRDRRAARAFVFRLHRLLAIGFGKLDFLGVCKPQGQFIAVDAQFHGVAHRRKLFERHFGTRDHAHIEEVLAQRAFSPNRLDNGALSDFQLVQFHRVLAFCSFKTRKTGEHPFGRFPGVIGCYWSR